MIGNAYRNSNIRSLKMSADRCFCVVLTWQFDDGILGVYRNYIPLAYKKIITRGCMAGLLAILVKTIAIAITILDAKVSAIAINNIHPHAVGTN